MATSEVAKFTTDNDSLSTINNSRTAVAPEVLRFTKDRRKLRKKLLLLILLMVTVSLVAVVAAFIVEKTKADSTVPETSLISKELCLTKECVLAAATIDRSIDYSVNPCDNFYKFACGRWEKENVIPEDKSNLNRFGILQDQVGIKLKSLLEAPIDLQELQSIKKAKILYASCKNVGLINERGDDHFKEYVIQEFSGWPLTFAGWNETRFNLETLLQALNRRGVMPMIQLYVGIDYKNSSKQILKIDQPSFGMPGQKYYQVKRNDTMLMAYEHLIHNIGSLLGFANQSSSLEEAKAIVDFEILLANISMPIEQRRNSNLLYNPMTLEEIQGNYSQILNWTKYVYDTMAQLDNAMQDFTSQEIMINQSPLYFERLTTVLTNTPKRTVANYLIWRFIIFVLKTSALGEKYMNLLTNYNKVLFGTSSERARFRICGSYTTNVLRLAVGRMFIENNFDPDSKIIGLDMIKELQVAFDELLEDLDWMDDPTKVVAKEKNSYIAPKIGYPEEIKNDTYIEELYSKLEFDENFFENILIVERESYYENLRELRKPIDKEKWSIAPSTVNAFYNPLNNQILFPAGILQPPFFSKTYPKSLNFGGIGVVIGHEITHGFDDRGRLYDKYGNLAKWWSPDAENKFKAKAQCIIDQYSNFTVTDIHMKINGVNTQGENIADNGGLKQAYRAYRNWVKTQGKEEQSLPGLHFSNNQLFFINFAQLWCTLMTEGDALNRVRIGSHSPGEFRVIGSVQNSHDFATAFQCPVGSSMNPIHKCHVW